MNKISVFLSKKLIEWEVINTKDFDIYYFGIQESLFIMLNVFTTLFIGLFSNKLWQTILYLVIYMQFRKYCGGYHASTREKCYFLSTLVIISFVLSYEFLIEHSFCVLSFFVISIIIISCFAPISNVNKPLDKKEISAYKTKVKIRTCIAVVSVSVLLLLKYNEVFTIIATAVSSVAFLILIEVYFCKNAEKREHKV